MFAPAPPRCWTRSSTRKDSETFAIFPSTNWSVNRPGKVIRWSVAIEPVTTTVIEDSLAGGRRPGQAPRQRTGQTTGSDIPWSGASSCVGGELGPGGVLAVEGSAVQAAVQDADEPVGKLSEGGVVADAAGSDRVVVGAGAG